MVSIRERKLLQEIWYTKDRIKSAKAELKHRHLIIGEAIGRKSSIDQIRSLKAGIREDEQFLKKVSKRLKA